MIISHNDMIKGNNNKYIHINIENKNIIKYTHLFYFFKLLHYYYIIKNEEE